MAHFFPGGEKGGFKMDYFEKVLSVFKGKEGVFDSTPKQSMPVSPAIGILF
jgi:hypothetical protein